MIVNKAENYSAYMVKQLMTGPSEIRLLDELLMKFPVKHRARILDLGCAMGLTSLYLANELSAQVIAVEGTCDLNANARSFQRWGVGNKVIPISGEANDLPFAENFFDSVVSICHLHKYAEDRSFFADKILPLIKPGGTALVAVPGLKKELDGTEPGELFDWLEDIALYRSTEWWESWFGKEGIELLRVFRLDNFDIAWEEWFSSQHEASFRDKEYFDKGLDQYLCFIGAVVKKRKK